MENIDPRLDRIKDCLYRVAVKTVVVHDGKLLGVIEPQGWYGLPGGGLDHGETLAQGITRELHEELQLTPTDYTIDEQPLFVTTGGIFQEIPRICVLFGATLHNPAALQAGELRFVWLTPKELHAAELSPSTTEAREFLLARLQAAARPHA
jgi:ADP-ribose pyrophosphatase YjhB (NUDIX family)